MFVCKGLGCRKGERAFAPGARIGLHCQTRRTYFRREGDSMAVQARAHQASAADTRLHPLRDPSARASRPPSVRSARRWACPPPRPCTAISPRSRRRASSGATRASRARWRCSTTATPTARVDYGQVARRARWSARSRPACPILAAENIDVDDLAAGRARRRGHVHPQGEGRLDDRGRHPRRRLRRRAAAADAPTTATSSSR